MIDTPIAWRQKELLAVDSALKRFAQVLVTEDYMNFPPFALMRQAVQDGLIGKPVGLTLYNIGYRYHGLALIRSLVGFRPVSRSWRRSVGTFSAIVGYRFSGGFQACVVGPYRRHTTGGMTLEGMRGVITDFAGDQNFGAPSGRSVYTLRGLQDGGLLTGYEIDGTEGRYRIDLPEVGTMAAMDFSDKSDLNLLRGCGLMTVFRALLNPANMNNDYGPANALYDSFISRLAERGRLPVDPFIWLGRDAMTAITAVARLRALLT